jgi:hypothetical protein
MSHITRKSMPRTLSKNFGGKNTHEASGIKFSKTSKTYGRIKSERFAKATERSSL